MSIPSIARCKEVGIILSTFHPHTSHKMQPLDRAVFGPFKTYYNSAVNQWMLTPGNSGKPLSIYEFAEEVGYAYPLSFTPNNITSGFTVTGLVPLNENISEEH
ncbi:DDE superfamily endonuclease [Popillia japonica]|uniref:DDE superfamily endonuclease n=1 Tax=Popillia japonica TaxID=7064 RepID=A0AAW1HWL8_POPJA